MDRTPPAPVLSRRSDGRRVVLVGRTVVGRRPDCELCIPSENVSTLHAVVSWQPGGWHVRDLGSLNGVSLGGRRIDPGRDLPIARGDVLEFGAGNQWELASDAPPVALAHPEGGGDPVLARGGLLLLGPDGVVCVYQDVDAHWVLERGSAIEEIRDRHRVELGDGSWVLRLPQGVPRTSRDSAPAPDVESLPLTLEVSRDEEHVRAWALHGGERIDLGSRGFLYLLVLLAGVRLDDVGRGLPDEECGWVHVDELTKMSGMSENAINVSIHRLRRLFADAGVQDAARIVERRAYRRMLRLGVRRPTVLRSG